MYTVSKAIRAIFMVFFRSIAWVFRKLRLPSEWRIRRGDYTFFVYGLYNEGVRLLGGHREGEVIGGLLIYWRWNRLNFATGREQRLSWEIVLFRKRFDFYLEKEIPQEEKDGR